MRRAPLRPPKTSAGFSHRFIKLTSGSIRFFFGFLWHYCRKYIFRIDELRISGTSQRCVSGSAIVIVIVRHSVCSLLNRYPRWLIIAPPIPLFFSLPLRFIFESNRMPSDHFAWPETRSETAAKPAAVNRFFSIFFLIFFLWMDKQSESRRVESWTESDSATIVNEIRQIDL